MATNCPKCNGKLGIFNWSANCPHCGVNLLYFDIERRLIADADAAESESARFSKKVSRTRAAFVGSPLAIIRIILTILPIGALFLPLVKGAISAPYISQAINVNAMRLYEMISSMNFGTLFSFAGSDVMGHVFTYYTVALVGVVLAALSALLSLIFLFLASSPLGKFRSLFFPSLGLVSTGLSMIMFSKFNALIAAFFPGAFNASFGVGAYVLVAAFALSLIINIIIAIKGIPVKYKEKFIGGIPSERFWEAEKNGEDIAALRAQIAADKKAAEAAAASQNENKEEKKEETESVKV